MSWWQQFPLTQAWSPPGEQGEDVATPFHTPLPPPFPGKVTRTRYGPFGGEVDIAANIPGVGNATEYILHEDQIFVHAGDTVTTDTITGLSGGQLSGGSHPATSQYSSGAHTEVGFWTGAPWTSQSLDPGPILAQAHGGTGTPLSTSGASQSPDVNTDIKIASLPIIGDITIPTDFLWRFGLIGLGSVLVVIGLIVMFKGPLMAGGKAAATVAAPEIALPMAAASSGGSATWGAGGRPVNKGTAGENRSDTFIKGFTTGTKSARPKIMARKEAA